MILQFVAGWSYRQSSSTGKVFTGLTQFGDLLIESFWVVAWRWPSIRWRPQLRGFPRRYLGQDQRLGDAYEDKPSEGRDAVSALPGRSGIGDEQAEAFAVADRGRGKVRSFGDLPDRHGGL
jgi:hypothetical protein